MPVDFSGLVLAPAMDAFAKPVTFAPTASQPSVAAFPARGVWSVRHLDVPLDGEGSLSARTLMLGIRLAEFATQPLQGDSVTITTDDQVTIPGVAIGTPVNFLIDDVQPDGQGGATLILKR